MRVARLTASLTRCPASGRANGGESKQCGVDEDLSSPTDPSLARVSIPQARHVSLGPAPEVRGIRNGLDYIERTRLQTSVL
jgi:hypothetical protein